MAFDTIDYAIDAFKSHDCGFLCVFQENNNSIQV